MSPDQYLVSFLFLLVTLLGYLVCRGIAQYFSGPGLNIKSFVLCFAIMLIWGASQLQISNSGTPLFFDSPLEYLRENEAVSWVAFLSIFFQGTCLPRSEKMTWPFIRKQNQS